MNYYKEGTLRDYLKSHRSRINLKDKIYFIYRICFALNRIHSKNLIHRDLHSANILLLTNRCLISDLGLCGPAENKLANNVYGVLPYTAPELFLGKQYSKASDIYSLGMLMWEIFVERPPFHDQPHNTYLMLRIVVNGERPERPPLSPVIPDKFQKLIERCWENDAKERPVIEEIYEIVNKEFINVYENEELMLEYDKNKRVNDFLEIPKPPQPIYYTSKQFSIGDTENFIIDSRFIGSYHDYYNHTFTISNENLHSYRTGPSLRYGCNEKVLYDVTYRSSDGNYLSFLFFYLIIQSY
jgi:serine/threonine protein kinase